MSYAEACPARGGEIGDRWPVAGDRLRRAHTWQLKGGSSPGARARQSLGGFYTTNSSICLHKYLLHLHFAGLARQYRLRFD